jgi:glycosyltransferase involved in cell wall biosynthesis
MLSIIIPTFQEEKYIGRLLESIKQQTLQPEEIIIADNHSTDKTREIAKEYGCKIVDGGNPAEGRNAGAKAAKGNFLLFLDADTQIKNKKFLEVFLKAFKDRNLDIATTFLTYDDFGLPNIIGDIGFNTAKILNEIFLKHLNKVSSETGACTMITKELFDNLGRFNEQMRVHEDSELFRKASKQGAKYGLIGLNIKTSDRKFKNLTANELVANSTLTVYGFLRRLSGLEDSEEFLKKYEDTYTPLGGSKRNSHDNKKI